MFHLGSLNDIIIGDYYGFQDDAIFLRASPPLFWSKSFEGGVWEQVEQTTRPNISLIFSCNQN